MAHNPNIPTFQKEIVNQLGSQTKACKSISHMCTYHYIKPLVKQNPISHATKNIHIKMYLQLLVEITHKLLIRQQWA